MKRQAKKERAHPKRLKSAIETLEGSEEILQTFTSKVEERGTSIP